MGSDSAEREASIQHISEGGVVAAHPVIDMQPVLVGPATAEERNRLRPALIPIGCLSLFDTRFEFDSSFVLPESAREFKELQILRQKLHDLKTRLSPSISLFGHADTAGQDEYNKALSGRRAQAVYAVLTRRIDLWEHLYNTPFGGDKWGLRIEQIMLNALLYDPGRTDGQMDEPTRSAIRLFQQENGLPPSGEVNAPTRHKLFEKYMDFLCRDAAGKPYRLTNEDFLARGADAGGKGDYQGCSDFNPILIFSQADHQAFESSSDKSERNAANAPNRRVLAFLFAPGTKITPGHWPCPHVSEGSGGCRKRFWSDALERRRFQEQERTFEQDKNTFACRFYHRLAQSSPCEILVPLVRIRLLDHRGQVLTGAPYRIRTLNREFVDFSDANGDAVITDVPAPSTCHVEWSRPAANAPTEASGAPQQTPTEQESPRQEFAFLLPSADIELTVPEYEFELDIFVDLTQVEPESAITTPMNAESARRRLNNLGYSLEETLEAQIRAFQRDCGEKETGLLATVEARLRTQHDVLRLSPRADQPET